MAATVSAPATGNIASGTDAITYTGGSFTPAANDLMVIWTMLDTETTNDWTLTDSGGVTFTKIDRVLRSATNDPMELWIANSLAAATARTLTYAHAATNALGANAAITLVTGMTRTGSSAVRSKGSQTAQTAATTPTPVMNQAALTTNPVISAVFNASASGNVTVPSTWNSLKDINHTGNTRGIIVAAINSGTTSATVTWGSTCPTIYGSYALELDITAASTADTQYAGMVPI